MSQIMLFELSNTLIDLQEQFVCLGRLNAIKVIHQNKLRKKLAHAPQTFIYIEAARNISEFLDNFYAINSPSVFWPYKTLKKLVTYTSQDGVVDLDELHTLSESTKIKAKLIMNHIEKMVQIETIYLPIRSLINQLKPLITILSFKNKVIKHFEPYEKSNKTGINRAIWGLVHPPLDNIFKPTFSLLKQTLPKYGDSIGEAASYYWCLSARECMASDMCSLTIMEYDGMPIDFYYDMAKQAWDEIRHAVFFLEVSEKLIPELILQLNKTDPLYQTIHEYQTTQTGLPIPLEKTCMKQSGMQIY